MWILIFRDGEIGSNCFLEAAREIAQNGLIPCLVSTATPGPVMGVGGQAEFLALRGLIRKGLVDQV